MKIFLNGLVILFVFIQTQQIFSQEKLSHLGDISLSLQGVDGKPATLIDFNQNLILLSKESSSGNELTLYLIDVTQSEFGKLKVVSKIEKIQLLNSKILSSVDFKEDGVRLFFISNFEYLQIGLIILDYSEKRIAFRKLEKKRIDNKFNGITRNLSPFEHRNNRWFKTSNLRDRGVESDDLNRRNDIISKFRITKNRTLLIPFMEDYPNGSGKAQPNWDEINYDYKFFVFDEIDTQGKLITESTTKVKGSKQAHSLVSRIYRNEFQKCRDLNKPTDLEFIKSFEKISNPLNYFPVTPILVENENKGKINFYNKSTLVFSFNFTLDKNFKNFWIHGVSDDLKQVIVTIQDRDYNQTTSIFKLPEFKFN